MAEGERVGKWGFHEYIKRDKGRDGGSSVGAQVLRSKCWEKVRGRFGESVWQKGSKLGAVEDQFAVVLPCYLFRINRYKSASISSELCFKYRYRN